MVTTCHPLEVLARTRPFQSMTPRARADLLRQGALVSFEPGERIVQQGVPAGGLYVIISGQAGVLQQGNASGASLPLAVLGPGELAGELSALDARPPLASVEALESVTALYLPRPTLTAFLAKEPEFARELAVALAGRLRAVTGLYAETRDAAAEASEGAQGYAALMLQGRDAERRRIAHELHDTVVQDLAALLHRLELLDAALPKRSVEVEAALEEARILARHAQAELRALSRGLRAGVPATEGLAGALRLLAEDLAQYLPGAKVMCEVEGDELALTPEAEVTVLRVAQEALNNIRKHAPGATLVTVDLIYGERGVTLTIEDNGPGFDLADGASLVQAGHLGLAGMRQRAALVGGRLTVTAERGDGTCVRLTVPGRDVR